MRTNWLSKLCAVAVALLPVAVRADLVAPHDQSFTDANCNGCHRLSNATPLGGLDFSGGCQACHANKTASTLAFPTAALEAKMGVKGTHHSWSGFAENAQAGAKAPASAHMARYLVDGRIQCITCHDLHNVDPTASPDSRHTSIDVGAATAPIAGATGNATITLVNPGTNMKVGYRIRLQSATSFIITKTAGAPAGPTWLKWTGSWVPGTAADIAAGVATFPGKTFTAGSPVVIEGDLSVQFSTGGRAGDQYEFWVGYPGLRLTLRANGLCVYCHSGMAMGHKRVAGADTGYPVDGTRTFSHPVGDALGANGLGSDRAAILDANGLVQGAGDSNPTNDLVLDGTVVRCTTCHAVHGADSNSLTTDKR